VHCKVKGQPTMSCAKTAEPIEMPLGMKNSVGPMNRVLEEVETSKGRGILRGSRSHRQHGSRQLHNDD